MISGIREEKEEHVKLYLCDGEGCGIENPKYCYKNGGDCIHTSHPEHSIKKKLGDIFPKTTWLNPSSSNLLIERVDNIDIMQYWDMKANDDS